MHQVKLSVQEETARRMSITMSHHRATTATVSHCYLIVSIISCLLNQVLSNQADLLLRDTNHYANDQYQQKSNGQQQQQQGQLLHQHENQYRLQEALIQLSSNSQQGPMKALDLKQEENQPDFLEPIGNYTIAAGRDAQLYCKINNLGTNKTAWLRVEDKGILTIHNNVITRNYRISLANPDNKNFILNIKNVQPSDRGGYMCQINTNPMKYSIGYLDVLTAPSFDETLSNSDVVESEGSNVTLSCKANGYPTPSISWRREDNEMIILNGPQDINSKGTNEATKIEGTSLNLARVTRLHSGAYLCIASNGVPPSTSKRIVLDVQYIPVIGLPQADVGVPLGQEATLTCNIESNPQSTNYWTYVAGSEEGATNPRFVDTSLNGEGDHNLASSFSQRQQQQQQQSNQQDLLGGTIDNEELINGDKYNIVIKQTSTNKAQMKLTIRNIQKSDYGLYRCLAKNDLGVQSDTIRLHEISFSEAASKQNQQLNYGNPGDRSPSQSSQEATSGDISQTNSELELFNTTPIRGQTGNAGGGAHGAARTHARSWNYRQSNDAVPTNSPSASSPSSSSSGALSAVKIANHHHGVMVLIVMTIISLSCCCYTQNYYRPC